ncbi:MAG: hypothetical protein QME66_05140 [Candidatus Eisenbacteria bacterium]|nr:hypothetical protein [Candidatus Eisenbacteria bacterium]
MRSRKLSSLFFIFSVFTLAGFLYSAASGTSHLCPLPGGESPPHLYPLPNGERIVKGGDGAGIYAVSLVNVSPQDERPIAFLGPKEGMSRNHSGKASREKISILVSLLIPGGGEYILGEKDRAFVFLAAEGAVWLSYVVYQVQGGMRKDSYTNFASMFAGTNVHGKSDDYYRALGKYYRSDPGPGSYNEDIRRDARFRYPNDREAQEEYLRTNGYFRSDGWEWVSDEKMAEYSTLRTSSVRAYHNAKLVLGAMVLNRIFSAVDDALILSKKTRDPGREGPRASVTFSGAQGLSFRVCLEERF